MVSTESISGYAYYYPEYAIGDQFRTVDVWLVVGAFLFMVVSNVLAQKKFFGGKDNKEISDEHPTYVSPDGLTFAIWGFIYLMLAVLVVAQVIWPWGADEGYVEMVLNQPACIWPIGCIPGLYSVRITLVVAFIANGIWLPVFNNEYFWSAWGIMTVYLVCLLAAYQNVNNMSIPTPPFVFTLGLAMNLSWIVVAWSLSLFFCFGLKQIEWNTVEPIQLGYAKDGSKVAGTVNSGIGVVFLVTMLGLYRLIFAGDYGYAFVAAWALRGIYRMQTIPDKVRFPISLMNSTLALCANFGCAAIALCGVVRLIFWAASGI